MQSLAPRGRRPVLPAVNGLRFVAAMHIVFIHSLKVRWFPVPLRSAIDAGYTSTSLLFILSGFVLTWVYQGEDGRLNVPRRQFLVARLSRIFPLMLVSQLLVLPLWLEHRPFGPAMVGLALGLSGQQAWWPPLAHALNTPAWAVTVLCLNYALFPATLDLLRRIPARWHLAALGGAWVACLVPGAVFHQLGATSDDALRVLYTFPLIRGLEFVFGVMLGVWLTARGPLTRREAAWMAAAGTLAWAGWLCVAYRFPVELIHNGLLAPVQGMLIAGLAYGGGWIGRVLAAKPVRELGERGLSIFLLHLPLLAWTQRAGLLPLPSVAASMAVYAAYLAVTLTLSVVVTDRFVTPAARMLRLRFTPAPPRSPAVPVETPATAVVA
jgi:peptidoglycan/LPS O-acetylase OafA/YrhL